MTFTARLLSRRTHGVAMFEVVCALALIAVVIVGAVLLYQSVTASNARAELVQLSRELRGGVERAWVGMGNYNGVTMKRLCDYGAVPASAMQGTGNCSARKFVAPVGETGTTGHSIGAWPHPDDTKKFLIGFKAISPAACRALLAGYIGQTENRSNFYGVIVMPPAHAPAYALFRRASGEDRHIASGYGAKAEDLDVARADALCSRDHKDEYHVFLAFR